MDRCANCRAVIGDLETPYLWREKVVCAACYARLSAATPPPATPPANPPADLQGKPSGPLTDQDIDSLLEAPSPPPVEAMEQAVSGSPRQVLDYANPSRLRAPPPPVKLGAVPCPVCGSTAAPVKKSKGSCLVLGLLLCIAILPGLIYAIFFSGSVLVCPQCGTKRGDIA